ncbi:MAG: RNA polymerase sigma factor [Propioniciclava sp.]
MLLAGWDGLDSGGIAAVLGISPTAVRARLSRARQRLTRELADEEPAPVGVGTGPSLTHVAQKGH